MPTGTHTASFLLSFPFLSSFMPAPGIFIERVKGGRQGVATDRYRVKGAFLLMRSRHLSIWLAAFHTS